MTKKSLALALALALGFLRKHPSAGGIPDDGSNLAWVGESGIKKNLTVVTCHKFAPLPWTSLFLGAPCTQASNFFEAFHYAGLSVHG